VSENNLQSFFDLRSGGISNPILPSGLTDYQLMKRAGFVVDELGPRYDATPVQGIDFARRGAASCLSGMSGLSVAETWGRWSDASLVKLEFTAPLPSRFVLHIRAQAFGPNAGQPAHITVGQETKTFVPSASMSDFALHFDHTGPSNKIEIQPYLAVSPHDLGISQDQRKLGIGLQRLWIEPARQE
jgi:phosphoglycerol transferase